MVKRLRAFRKEKHLDPILQSIEFLPKNELAHVAASLVNLSSFQKRMSIGEDETVGGPIDVAVISKGMVLSGSSESTTFDQSSIDIFSVSTI